MYAHNFIRKKNLKAIQQSEVLARAVLGILRSRAVREAFDIFSSNFKTLLVFNLAESLPGGFIILDSLYRRMERLNASYAECDASGTANLKRKSKLRPFSLLELSHWGIILDKVSTLDEEATFVGDVSVGESNPLEMAVRRSMSDTRRAEEAQATVEKVKVEGIDTNLAVLKVSMIIFH